MRMLRIRLRTLMLGVCVVALGLAYQKRLSRSLEPEPITFALLPVAYGLLACVAIDWIVAEYPTRSRRRRNEDTLANPKANQANRRS